MNWETLQVLIVDWEAREKGDMDGWEPFSATQGPHGYMWLRRPTSKPRPVAYPLILAAVFGIVFAEVLIAIFG